MPGRRKKDPVGNTSNKSDLCKTGCGRKIRTEGFCGICYPKFLKNYFLDNGEVNPEIAAKERAQAEKKKQKDSRKKVRELQKDKELLSKIINKSTIKLLVETHPEYSKPKGCPRLNFWVSDAECIQRLYVLDHKHCKKCTLHDDKVPFLKEFISLNAAEELI